MKTLDDFSKEDAQSAADASQQPRVDDADERENGENTTTVDWVDPTQQEKKKKRRTKKPKSKRGRVSLSTWTTLLTQMLTDQNKPTGFEEYYVDAPITPEQYNYEREIYDVTRPIIQ